MVDGVGKTATPARAGRAWLRRLVHPRWGVVVHDLVMIWGGWLAARAIATPGRQGFDLPLSALFLSELPLVIGVQGAVFWITGLYRGLWRFASLPDLWNLVRGALVGTLLVAVGLWLWFPGSALLQPRLLLIYPLALVLLLGAPRLLYRSWKDYSSGRRTGDASRRTLLLGAGHSGVMLARELKPAGRYRVVGFLDDAPALRGARIHGIPVLGTVDQLPRVAVETAAEVAIIAMPSLDEAQMQRVVGICEDSGIAFQTMPSLRERQQGVRWDELKPVRIEDLLGRTPVELDWQAIRRTVHGSKVLVTGGGGSIGAELARQIQRLGPAKLIIVERNEYNLFNIQRDMRGGAPSAAVRYVLGDAGDPKAMQALLAAERPDIIFHAAAYKHLPLLQAQMRAAVRNNLLATRVLAEAAAAAGVPCFVLISTDKAVRPRNVMGATKRAAELYCEGLGQRTATRFVTVRFGNVLNSSGSVVPLFQQQIAAGGPVTVTDPQIERYFMTIPEAAQLILQATVIGENSDILVLDMGEPVRILTIAHQLIRLAGKEPERDIPIVFTGLRAGEKLSEELFHENERLKPTGHPKILRARHEPLDWTAFTAAVESLAAALDGDDPALACAFGALMGTARIAWPPAGEGGAAHNPEPP